MKKDNYINLLMTILFMGTISFVSLNITSNTVKAAEDSLEDKLFKRIEAADGINNLEKVKDDIKRVLKLNPKHVGATFYAGKYCFQKADFENANKFLNRIIYDPVYGKKANGILANIRIKKYNSRFLNNLKVYLNGESFGQALQLCEEALSDMPDNEELLLSASYACCMLEKKEKALTYCELYALRTNNSPLAAELKTLVDAWFTESFDNDVAIEKFLSIKSKSLFTAPVKRRIKKLLIATKSFNRYEDFIKKEMDAPGADRDSLERELITFLLEQHQYNRALDLLNKRPVDSLEDNLLYVWALSETNQDLKALSTAKSLINMAPRDLRTYRAWVEAWNNYTEKNKAMPEGKDITGTSYDDTLENIFKLLRPEKLVDKEPILLINLLRMASFTSRDVDVQKIQIEVAKIDFTEEHEKLLLKMADELVAFNRSGIAVNILESAVNQLPNNYNLSLKLAQIYMGINPTAAIRICEEVMEQNPNLIRAFIMWSDAMNLAGRGGEAVTSLVEWLSDDSLNDEAKRVLNQKLQELRIQGREERRRKRTEKRQEGKRYNNKPKEPEVEEKPVENEETAVSDNTENSSDIGNKSGNDDSSVDESESDNSSSSENTKEGSSSNSDINSYTPGNEDVINDMDW